MNLKKLLLYCWLLMPVLLLAYHYGPGQVGISRDGAADHLAAAQSLEQQEDWAAAAKTYLEVLAKLPSADREARWKVRLAQVKARMRAGELPEVVSEFENLLAELEKENAPAALKSETRASLAMAQYYAGWLMRLEGAPKEEWTTQVDGARQQYRLLAEEALKAEPAAAKGHQENLEATIRLARMDLSELEGLPLPKFCQGCKDVSQKCRCQSQSQSKKPAEKEAKDARGAGTGQRPRGGS
jgi:hypothetical protein